MSRHLNEQLDGADMDGAAKERKLEAVAPSTPCSLSVNDIVSVRLNDDARFRLREAAKRYNNRGEVNPLGCFTPLDRIGWYECRLWQLFHAFQDPSTGQLNGVGKIERSTRSECDNF